MASRAMAVMMGITMMARIIPADRNPTPNGCPWNSGRKPSLLPSQVSIVFLTNGTSTNSPHNPIITLGMAASISITRYYIAFFTNSFAGNTLVTTGTARDNMLQAPASGSLDFTYSLYYWGFMDATGQGTISNRVKGATYSPLMGVEFTDAYIVAK